MSSSLPIPHNSGSFIVPKKLLEDDSTTLLDLYDWNGEQNPQHLLFCYHDESETRTISWKEAVDATHRAAYYFEPRTRKSENEPTIAAVLANTGAPFKAISYLLSAYTNAQILSLIFAQLSACYVQDWSSSPSLLAIALKPSIICSQSRVHNTF